MLPSVPIAGEALVAGPTWAVHRVCPAGEMTVNLPGPPIA
jgi:hypothetical protein